jgi:Protein of unknown function (DUF3313)
MTTSNRVLRPILFSAALAWLCALGGTAMAATGYVGDIAGLSAISQPGFDMAFGKAGALPKGYDAVYVAPVGVLEGQDKALDALSAVDRQEMQAYLYAQLTKELGKTFSLVDKPGPGVLIVAASFNALKANKPTMSDLQRNPGIDYGRSFGIGSAGVQIDLRDGATDELLGAFVDHETGESLDTNTRAIVRWGDAEQFCRDWAHDLAASLGT